MGNLHARHSFLPTSRVYGVARTEVRLICQAARRCPDQLIDAGTMVAAARAARSRPLNASASADSAPQQTVAAIAAGVPNGSVQDCGTSFIPANTFAN